MPPTDAPGTTAGKVAVITGGASGIGRATALEVARQAVHVVVADIINRAARTQPR